MNVVIYCFRMFRSGLSASEIQSPDSNDSGIGLQADDNSQPDDNGNYA